MKNILNKITAIAALLLMNAGIFAQVSTPGQTGGANEY